MPATLTSLRIRNLALVEDLLWEPGPGFVAITGETGAGKSIILGALHLVIGERADRSIIRSGSNQCTVEAAFNLDDSALWSRRLEAEGLDPEHDGTLLIRRQISGEGTGKQFINGSPATLAALRNLGEWLVDLHGPHDHQSLFSPARQLEIADAGLRSRQPLESYAALHRERAELLAEIRELEGNGEPPEREIALLRHQISEIEAAAIRPDEETGLHRDYQIATNARRLAELAAEILAALGDEERGAATRLSEAVRGARELARLDPRMEPLSVGIAQAAEILQESCAGLARYGDQIDLDGARLATLEARVNLLESLKRKYGGSLESITAHAEECAARLARLEGRGERLDALAKQLAELEPRWRAAAGALGAARKSAGAILEKKVASHLADLEFLKAGFRIEWEPVEPPNANGAERSQFLFAANPGEPFKPLKAVASSGEVSRVMLAIKSAMTAADGVGLLVFDEIDANVGGEIAVSVGRKLASLADSRQIFCITHLPQVASLAVTHWLVRKEVSDDRTVSTLIPLEGETRIRELARMLGGQTKEALLHARALLERK